jgi:hypothetical protein
MNQSIWERRQAVASRLGETVRQERTVRDDLVAVLAQASLVLDDVDPHGHLAAAVTSVAHGAADTPGSAVVLGLPAGGHGVRVESGPDGRVRLVLVALTVSDPAPKAVASELAALLWDR